MNKAKSFDHLIFDLDDTLLDTYNQLVPRAAREACSAMIAAGLNSEIETCLKTWDAFRGANPRGDVFQHLVEHFGVKSTTENEAVANRGFFSFYNRRVETGIHLFPGVKTMLRALNVDYSLHLVTAGARSTQEEKIRLLEIEGAFESIWHVDPSRGEHKRDAFVKIMERTQQSADRYLSIGNRIDTDIGPARELGWKACWVKAGEYRSMVPANSIETPDFIVNNVIELPETCRL